MQHDEKIAAAATAAIRHMPSKDWWMYHMCCTYTTSQHTTGELQVAVWRGLVVWCSVGGVASRVE